MPQFHKQAFHRRAGLPKIPPTPTSPAESSSTSSTSTSTSTPSTGTSTSTGTDTSTSTDSGGLLGGLLPGGHSTSSSSSSTSSTSSSSSTSSTSTSTAPVVASTKSSNAATQTSDSSGTSSTVFQTVGATPSNTAPPGLPTSDNSSNPDAGPIAGGVIGGLFAVAALGMLISFLLRRWRRKRIDKEIFGSSSYRNSAFMLEDHKDDYSKESVSGHNPRPPTMIERRAVGGGQYDRSFAGADPSMFTAPAPYGGPPHVASAYGNHYAAGGYGPPGIVPGALPGYPPTPAQRGYYSQDFQQQQPAGYNQMYGQHPPPSRTHTPQIQPVGFPPQMQMQHQHAPPQQPGTPFRQSPVQVQQERPPSTYTLPNPFGQGELEHGGGGGHVEVGADAVASTRGHTTKPSIQSDGDREHMQEELPTYAYDEDAAHAEYADLQRDAKPRPDSEGPEKRQPAVI